MAGGGNQANTSSSVSGLIKEGSVNPRVTFNRPGVAGAVQHTALFLIKQLGDGLNN